MAVMRKAEASTPSHPMESSPGAPLQQVQADVGGHSGQCGQRDMGDEAEPNRSNPRRKTPWRRLESRVVPPHRTLARLLAGMPTLIGGAEDAGAKVGDPVRTELPVGIDGAEVAVPPLEVFDHLGRDQDVDRRDERQSEGRRQDRRGRRSAPR